MIYEYTELVLNGSNIDNEVLRSIHNRVVGKKIQDEQNINEIGFFDFAFEFIEEKRGSIEDVTKRLYMQSLKIVESCSESQNTSISFDSFTIPIINDFKVSWRKREFRLNTVSKHFMSLKTVVLEGRSRG